MKKFVFASILAAMTLLSACGETEVSAPPLADSISVVYDTAPVERGDVIATLVYDGSVMPNVAEAAMDEASGTVDRLFVRVGDEVSAGDAILKLDTEAAEESLEAARESLAELVDTGALGRRLVEIDLELAKLSLEETEAGGDSTAISLAKIEVERCEIALDDYDLNYSKQTASVRSQIAELEASIAACTLRSPIDGTVASLPEEGAYASAASAVATVASEDGRFVIYDGVGNMPSGRPTSAIIDGVEVELVRYEYTDRENAAFDARGETPPPRFVCADGGELPASGTYVQIRVERERSENTLRLPTGAVRRDSGVSYVYLVENGEKIYTEVKTGATSNAYVEILEGLSEGDEVYVGN